MPPNNKNKKNAELEKTIQTLTELNSALIEYSHKLFQQNKTLINKINQLKNIINE